MNQDRSKRKLTAILSADVVGYSRLMDIDEAWTINNLEENKGLIGKFIEEYGGRVIDAIGDNLLAEFSSIVNSVECAVKIQQELKKKNDTLVEDRRMHFRIGVNLGDVIEEDGRIYGSGVNIASRLEGLAEPGGICISGRTYDHIKTKLGLGYKFLGEHNVKNISEPIRIYRLLMDSEKAGKVIGEKKAPSRVSYRIAMAAVIVLIIIAIGLTGWIIYSHESRKIESPSTEPEQTPVVSDAEEAPKSIAVLPFADLSPKSDQGYFVDGLSEEILNSLAQIPNLNVTGRTSSFSFKGTNMKAQEIADELGVDHILEGSVRKDGNALRITAQLLRGEDGFHLWSETYDRELKEIFSVQENIAKAVADQLKITLGIEQSLKQLGGTENIEAYELYLVAQGQVRNWDLSCLELLNKAIMLDPEFALAWQLKALVHNNIALISSAERVSSELDAALKAALKAIELEPRLREAYSSLGGVYMNRGEFIEAEKAFRKGMELDSEPEPNFWAYFTVGHLRKNHGIIEELRRNDPFAPLVRAAYLYSLILLGDMEQVEKEYERGKAVFGDQWRFGDIYIAIFRLGAKDVSSINEIPELPAAPPSYAIGRENIGSPENGLLELRRLYNSDENIGSAGLTYIGIWAAYYGDPEFALNAIKSAASLNKGQLSYLWPPLMQEVRKLPRFKEYVREVGLVDYWKEFGWPDLCRPVGDDDFVCD